MTIGVDIIDGTGYDHVIPALMMEKSFIASSGKSDLPSAALARQLVIGGIDPRFLSVANVWVVHSGMLFLVAILSRDDVYISSGVGHRRAFSLDRLYHMVHLDGATKVWGVLTAEDKEFISEEL